MKIPGPQPGGFKLKPIHYLSARDRDLGALGQDRADLLKVAKNLLAATAKVHARFGDGIREARNGLREAVREIGGHRNTSSEDNVLARNKELACAIRDRVTLIAKTRALLNALETHKDSIRGLEYDPKIEKSIKAAKTVITEVIWRD